MTEKQWEMLRAAVDILRAGGTNRIDGDGYKAYVVPNTGIRIDILEEKKP
jgi:hypothetical protein